MKKFIAVLLAVSLSAVSLAGCQGSSDSEGLTPVTLNEVAHSIFYAPQYAAIELGYFKDEGIDLTLVNGAGADKVMTALISGDAEIGFMGSEASIYVYQEGSKDYAVNFAQLTQRAGNFLVGRGPQENFSWQDLEGKKVLGGRAGGRPDYDVTLEHIKTVYERTSRKENNCPRAVPAAHCIQIHQHNCYMQYNPANGKIVYEGYLDEQKGLCRAA